MINGVYHGIIRGASIINRSGGGTEYLAKHGGGVTQCAQLQPGNDGYCDALALAERRHIVVVAATGNDDKTDAVGFPSSQPSVLAVGATIDFENLWTQDFSGGFILPNGTNRIENGTKPELVAPGKRLISTFYTGGTWQYNCNDDLNADLNPLGVGQGFDECTGTSMATPVVTGVVAIVRSVNPLLTRSDVVSRVLNTGRVTASGYKMPDTLASVQNVMATNSSISPMFAMVTVGSNSNRFYTSSPQMARAAFAGTMLPTLNQSTVPVYYTPDVNAATTAGYTAFPDTAGASIPPRAYFKVWTRFNIGGIGMVPLYRLSKLQNRGDGKDECGFNMPLPSKPIPVQHVYTTNVDELAALQTATNGNCFKLDGIEGYVAWYNMTGALEELYRLYNPTADSFIVVPTSKIALANSLGYTHYPWWLGWVVPN